MLALAARSEGTLVDEGELGRLLKREEGERKRAVSDLRGGEEAVVGCNGVGDDNAAQSVDLDVDAVVGALADVELGSEEIS